MGLVGWWVVDGLLLGVGKILLTISQGVDITDY